MRHPDAMLRDLMEASPRGATAPPFLPLAFRLATSFGLLVLHLAFPPDPIKAAASESLYLLLVSLFFIEAVWEIQRSLKAGLDPFATPGRASIRSNLAMDITLVALLIAFQGVDQERFAAIYLFPILSSAFYLGTTEIVLVGFIAFALHLSSFLLFGAGILPPFGHSGAPMDLETAEWILAFASLEIFAATLIVVLIRRNLEGLRRTLLASEAKVDDLSALHRRVVESMVSGLITTDLDGRITSANPAAEAILQRALPMGRTIDAILPVDLARQEILPREQRFEGSYIAPNGAWRLYGGNVAPLRDAEGNQSGHLMLFQDLTEIKALEERTRLSERLAAIGELSAGLAHELRNPLASILGCVQILKGEGHAHAMNERALGILSRESDRVSAILTKFLDFTRPKPVEIRCVYVPDLIEELRASWETDPRAKGLSLGIAPVPEVRIKADALCAHQVFTNLLTNARKALEGAQEPRVHLEFEEDANHLLVQVRDNGCGMDAEQLRTLFVPFSSTFKEGTGLGMSLVFQFVQAMGWDIRVQSQLNQGTLVSLKIPLWGSRG
ncbi:MAG: PAS domain S-box protein [Holophagaceae bacterium]|nr:PAS domain S-box protein [Holophagaceae bacterium]